MNEKDDLLGKEIKRHFDTLGLDESADAETIKRSYSVLLKKHKNDENKLNEINMAYNCLMGYHVVDEEEERYAASKAGKFVNFWYHNKIQVIVIMLTTFALVALVINSIRNVPVDVNLHFIGDLYVRQIDKVHDDIKQHLENSSEPNVEQLNIESKNMVELQFASDARMKLTSLIATGQLDVIISDYNTFVYLASQGLFMPLDISKTHDKYVVEDGTAKFGDFKLSDTLNEAAGTDKKHSAEVKESDKLKIAESENVVYAIDNFGKMLPLGVRLVGTKFLDLTAIEGRDLVMSLFYQPAHYDISFEMVDLILNFDPTIPEVEEEDTGD